MRDLHFGLDMQSADFYLVISHLTKCSFLRRQVKACQHRKVFALLNVPPSSFHMPLASTQGDVSLLLQGFEGGFWPVCWPLGRSNWCVDSRREGGSHRDQGQTMDQLSWPGTECHH